MKYLAILSDSLREAMDTFVFYLMVILSLVVIILVSLFSFTPRPVDDLKERVQITLNIDVKETVKEFQKNLQESRGPGGGPGGRGGPRTRGAGGGFNPFAQFFKGVSKVTYTVKGVVPVGGAADAPDSPFVWTVRAQFPTEEGAAEARKGEGPTADHLRQHFASLGDVHFFDVADLRQAKPGDPGVPENASDREVFYEIETRPNHYTRRVWPCDTAYLFGLVPFNLPQPVPLGLQLYIGETVVVGSLGATITLLVSVVITGFFIPNMLRKGTVDLLVVKPISRSLLLLYKYIGGLTFIVLNTVVAVGGIWLVLGLRSGVWGNGFLLTIPVLTLAFATLYAVSTLFGVLTRSTIVAILMACLFWGFLYGVGAVHAVVEQFQKQEELAEVPPEKRNFVGWWVDGIDVVHRSLPRYRDLVTRSELTVQNDLFPDVAVFNRVAGPEVASWQECLLVSLAWIGGLLGLSCFFFSRRDY